MHDKLTMTFRLSLHFLQKVKKAEMCLRFLTPVPEQPIGLVG